MMAQADRRRAFAEPERRAPRNRGCVPAGLMSRAGFVPPSYLNLCVNLSIVFVRTFCRLTLGHALICPPLDSYRTEAQRGDLPDGLARLHERGVELGAVCTGGLLFAEAGALDGRPAVTHAEAMADLRETSAEVVDARVVNDGDVLTAGDVTSGLTSRSTSSRALRGSCR